MDNNAREWIFVGRGSGSEILLLVIVYICVYCNCGKQMGKQARYALYRPDTEHENLNMKHTKVDAVGSVVQSELGQETVRVQSSESSYKSVQFNDQVYGPGSLIFLDQLQKFGIDVNSHHRTSRSGSHALPGSGSFL